MITILAHDSTGVLTVAIKGKRYTYFGVSPYIRRKLELWIAHSNFGIVFKTLKLFSNRSLALGEAA